MHKPHSLCTLVARTLLHAASLMLPLASIAAEPTVFVVRHAEKAESTTGDPKDPELSQAGRARADSLAFMLKDAAITSVYATEFKRTQKTAEPFARARGLRPTIVPAKDTAALVARLKQADGNVLVVGHSNTVPEILKELGASEPITLDESEYDNLFIWRAGPPPQLIRLHFR